MEEAISSCNQPVAEAISYNANAPIYNLIKRSDTKDDECDLVSPSKSTVRENESLNNRMFTDTPLLLSEALATQLTTYILHVNCHINEQLHAGSKHYDALMNGLHGDELNVARSYVNQLERKLTQTFEGHAKVIQTNVALKHANEHNVAMLQTIEDPECCEMEIVSVREDVSQSQIDQLRHGLSSKDSTYISGILKGLRQGAKYCDYARITCSTKSIMPSQTKFKKRLLLLTEFRFLCIRKGPMGMRTVQHDRSMLDCVQVEICARDQLHAQHFVAMIRFERQELNVWIEGGSKEIARIVQHIMERCWILKSHMPIEQRPVLRAPRSILKLIHKSRIDLENRVQVSHVDHEDNLTRPFDVKRREQLLAIQHIYVGICDKHNCTPMNMFLDVVNKCKTSQCDLTLELGPIFSYDKNASIDDLQCIARALEHMSGVSSLSFRGANLSTDSRLNVALSILSNISHDQLMSFSVTYSGCTYKSVRSIMKTLLTIRIQRLELSGNAIGDSGISELISSFEQFGSQRIIQDLDIAYCEMSGKGISRFAHWLRCQPMFLAKSSGLRSLDISGNHIGRLGIESLAMVVAVSNSLEKLALADMGNVSLLPILEAICSNAVLARRRLRCVDFSRNTFSTNTINLLSQILMRTDTLADVRLSHCRLHKDAAAEIIGHTLSNPNQDKSLAFILDLSANNLSGLGARMMGIVTTYPGLLLDNLYALNLSNCQLSTDDIDQCCDALFNMKHIVSLALDYNFTNKLRGQHKRVSLPGLIRLVGKSISLRHLSLNGNSITSIIKPLLECIASNSLLQVLEISSCALNSSNQEYVSALSMLLSSNSSLRMVNIDDNHADLKLLQSLQNSLENNYTIVSVLPQRDVQRLGHRVNADATLDPIHKALQKNMMRLEQRHEDEYRGFTELISIFARSSEPRSYSWTGRQCNDIVSERVESRFNRITDECMSMTSIASPTFQSQGDGMMIKFPIGIQLAAYPSTPLHGYVSPIPNVLLELQKHFLTSGGRVTHGIFRIAPESSQVLKVQRLWSSAVLERAQCDPHIFSHLLKKWLRDLPKHLLSGIASEKMSAVQSYDDAMQIVNENVMEPEHSVLMWLITFLADVASAQNLNLMSPKSLAIMLTPNLIELDETVAQHSAHAFQDYSRRFVELLIEGKLRHEETIQ